MKKAVKLFCLLFSLVFVLNICATTAFAAKQRKCAEHDWVVVNQEETKTKDNTPASIIVTYRCQVCGEEWYGRLHAIGGCDEGTSAE